MRKSMSGHPMVCGLVGAIRLPAYALAKAGAYAILGRWRVEINVDSVFDRRYFMANTDANANVLPGIGRTARLKLAKVF